MKRKLFLFCWLLLFCFLNSSHSFSLLGYRWPNPYFEYFINPENNDVNADSTIQAIRAGANVWNQWCRAIYGGRTTQKVIRNDGKNTVFFRESEYGAIASTYIFHRGPAILDIHIVFWDRKWQFYPGDTGCVQGFYLEDEATHEFGHAIGLGHSEFQGASMFAHTPFCNHSIRTLSQDDINAANQLYGTLLIRLPTADKVAHETIRY